MLQRISHTAAFLLVGLPTLAQAGLLSPAAPLGIHSRQAATARAMSSFASDFTAAISNPASLADAGDSQISLGYLYSQPSFRLDGESVDASRGSVAVFGLKIGLSSLTEANTPIGFGLALALDNNFGTLLSLSDSPSPTGQFLRAGQSQLLLVPAVGIELTPWLRVGGGAQVTVAADATLRVQTTLAGETSNEAMEMSGGSRMAPEAGIVLGPWDAGPVQKLSFAAAYRAAAWYELGVSAQADATLGSTPLTTLPLNMRFIDAYRPHEVALAARASLGMVDVGVTLEYERWSDLGRLLQEQDVVRSSAGLRFANVLSPKVGIEAHLPLNLEGRAGYAYQPSPLRAPEPSALNAIDNDRHILAVGVGYTLPARTFLLRRALSVDAAYQLEMLAGRTFTLMEDGGGTREARADGMVQALHVTLTLRF